MIHIMSRKRGGEPLLATSKRERHIAPNILQSEQNDVPPTRRKSYGMFSANEFACIMRHVVDTRPFKFVSLELSLRYTKPADIEDCIRQGDLATLQWAYQYANIELLGNYMFIAAYSGQMLIMQWLADVRCPWGANKRIFGSIWYLAWGPLLTLGREIDTILPYMQNGVPLIGWRDAIRRVPAWDEPALIRYEMAAIWLLHNAHRALR